MARNRKRSNKSSKKNPSLDEFKPILSVLIVITTLMTIVFFKMEVRRLGYVVWKKSHVERKKKDEVRRVSIELARRLGPVHIDRYAQDRLDLKKAGKGQVIRMSNQVVAMKQ